MDFDTILYILLMVGWLGFTILKNLKKDEAERSAHKNKQRPIVVETSDNDEDFTPKKETPRYSAPQSPKQDEYFSYETMSDRDFEQAFSNNVEENEHIAAAAAPHSAIHLNMDEEEVYKGIVWSEILNRKY